MADEPDAPDTGDDNTDDKPDEQGDDAAKWKSLSRKHERDAKALATRLKELEDAGKSDTEKLTARVSELEPKLTAAETRATRLEVALDKGLPKSLAVRLQGETREEMEADADELVKTLGSNGRKQPSFDNGVKDKDAPSGGSFLQEALANRGR